MKKWLLSVLSVLCMLMMALGLTACGGGGGASENGTYYEYVSNDYNRSSYVSLNDGSWTDNDGYAGTYTITNGEIVFIVDGFPLMDGEISNGVIKIPSLFGATYYCKEGKTPSNMGNGGNGGGNGGGSNQPPATTYTVTYNSNGGTFADSTTTKTDTVAENSLLTAPESPTRTGYRFSGWSKNAFGTDMWKFDENVATSDVTLYAAWVQESAKILSVENATITGTDIVMVVAGDVDSVSLSSKVVCSSDSTWKLYYDNLGQMEIPTKIAASTTGVLQNGDNVFYMVVTSQDGTQVNVYKLTVHRQYLIPVTYYHFLTPLEMEMVYSGDEYVADYVPTIEGYTFNGWKTLDGEAFTSGQIFLGLSLYADATANTYTVTMDVNGGEELTENTQEMTYDSTFTLPVPTRTGYTFLGWYNDDVAVTTGEGNGILVWKIAQDITLQARWEVSTYQVTASANISNAGNVQGTGVYEHGTDVTLTATTNNGYTWLGWYDGETKVTEELTYTFRAMEDKIFTAKYEVMEGLENFEFTSTSTTITITGVKDTSVTEMVIPDCVTSIESSAFSEYISVTSATIPTWAISYIPKTNLETVVITSGKRIDDEGFKNCSNLTSVTIGDSVESIGKYAFRNCDSLTSVTIGDSVESIGNVAFYSCYSLTKVNYTGTIDDWAQISFGNAYANPIYYANNLYINDILVTEANITTATKISDYAFRDCDSLTSVTIGDSVTSIGNYAFEDCDSLTSVTIGNSVTSIGSCAFLWCYRLVEVINESTHITVGKGSNSNGYVGYYALAVYNSGYTFTGTKLSNDNGYIIYTGGAEKILVGYIGEATDLTLPNYITKISQYAFADCESLTSVTIGDGVTSIGEWVFYGCDSLTSVTIPESVTSIGDYAFRDCDRLVEVINESTHITVEKGSASNGYVGYYALEVFNSGDEYVNKFANDNGYIIYSDNEEKILLRYEGEETDLILPAYVTKIYHHAFYNFDSLTSVTIGDSVETIGESAFSQCTNLTSVTIGDSVESIGKYAFKYCTRLTSIDIPDSVESIGFEAFYNCDSLTSVTINSGSIDDYAFSQCSSLTSVTIRDGVEGIGEDMFSECSSLTNIIIPDSVTFIDNSAFRNCTSLTEIIIPDSVKRIGNSAFYGCSSLTSVTIPESVTSINSYAFYGCDSLTGITFEDTSTWYRTTSSSGVGTPTNVTTPSTNATLFNNTYYKYYWYKK